MFQIGFWEIIVVLVVALWVLGPEKLPAVARLCARYFSRAKNALQTIQQEINTEFQREDIEKKNKSLDKE